MNFEGCANSGGSHGSRSTKNMEAQGSILIYRITPWRVRKLTLNWFLRNLTRLRRPKR